MEAFAVSKFNRISIKKIQSMIPLLLKKNYLQALNLLLFLSQKSSAMLLKVLKGAGANLLNKGASNELNWFIQDVMISRGSYYKRIIPKARGRAGRIRKPSVHIKIILSEEVLNGPKS